MNESKNFIDAFITHETFLLHATKCIPILTELDQYSKRKNKD